MLDRRIFYNFCLIFSVFVIISIFKSSILNQSTDLPSTSYKVYTLSSNSNISTIDDGSSFSNLDYNRLIDLNFTFNIFNMVCNDSSPTFLLVMVHSAPRNAYKRDTIRNTWGGSRKYVKVLFMIGSVENTTLQEELIEENNRYADIIQGSFLDSYRNMTYKHVMVLKYATYHCNQAKYVLKTDDDVFVNMPLMVKFVNKEAPSTNLIFCTIAENIRVLRSFRSKWRVSFKEYPDKEYPTYCPGWALLYSSDVVLKLYKEAQITPYFWIDDVHITGTLAQKLHLNHTNNMFWVLSEEEVSKVISGKGIRRPFLFGPYNMLQSEIKSMWKYILRKKQSKNRAENYVPQ